MFLHFAIRVFQTIFREYEYLMVAFLQNFSKIELCRLSVYKQARLGMECPILNHLRAEHLSILHVHHFWYKDPVIPTEYTGGRTNIFTSS